LLNKSDAPDFTRFILPHGPLGFDQSDLAGSQLPGVDLQTHLVSSGVRSRTMATASNSYDVVIVGSGIAGLAGALAAHDLGLRPVVLEKAEALGGGTVHSYGLIWVGQNHLARDAEIADSRDEVVAYLRFLGGGAVDEARLAAFVSHSPEVLEFFAACGIRFRLVRGVTDHYYDKAAGSHAEGVLLRSS
jgi:glycine/D-amino acid oxidase-like deaminating enzyme